MIGCFGVDKRPLGFVRRPLLNASFHAVVRTATGDQTVTLADSKRL